MDKEHRIMQNTSFDAGMTDPEGFKEYICSTFRKALDEGWIQAIVVQFSRQKSEDFLVSPKREAEWTGGSPVDGYAA